MDGTMAGTGRKNRGGLAFQNRQAPVTHLKMLENQRIWQALSTLCNEEGEATVIGVGHPDIAGNSRVRPAVRGILRDAGRMKHGKPAIHRQAPDAQKSKFFFVRNKGFR